MSKRNLLFTILSIPVLLVIVYKVYSKRTGEEQEDKLEYAIGLHEKGRLNEAVDAYKELLELGGQSQEILFNELADVYIQLGIYDSALISLNCAIAENTLDYLAYNNRGRVKELLGDSLGAYHDYSASIVVNNAYAPAYNSRGFLNLQRRKLEEAIKDFDKAISLDGSYYVAYSNRANAYYRIGNLQEAIRDYDIAINIKNDFSKAYINRGIVKFGLGNKNGACSDWNTALELGDVDAKNLIESYCQ